MNDAGAARDGDFGVGKSVAARGEAESRKTGEENREKKAVKEISARENAGVVELAMLRKAAARETCEVSE